jgi:hypothetical protein
VITVRSAAGDDERLIFVADDEVLAVTEQPEAIVAYVS